MFATSEGGGPSESPELSDFRGRGGPGAPWRASSRRTTLEPLLTPNLCRKAPSRNFLNAEPPLSDASPIRPALQASGNAAERNTNCGVQRSNGGTTRVRKGQVLREACIGGRPSWTTRVEGEAWRFHVLLELRGVRDVRSRGPFRKSRTFGAREARERHGELRLGVPRVSHSLHQVCAEKPHRAFV